MSIRFILASFTLCLGLIAAPAYAKRGIGLINYGDELFEVADFPAEILADNPGAKELKAGYKCSHFGVFWADVWTWDCKLVGVAGEKSYSDLPTSIESQLMSNPQYSFSHAQRGFWNHYAFWTALLGFAAFAAFAKFRAGRATPVVDRAHADTVPA